jgi:hypothetical protein
MRKLPIKTKTGVLAKKQTSVAKPWPIVFTIGHSTRTIEEFIALLQAHGVTHVVDVRTVPRSWHNPQFNRDALPISLNAVHIGYEHMAGLGGWRQPQHDSVNMGWRNSCFQGYADYMQTPAFGINLQALIKLAKLERIAIMCAEAVPWHCHRALIADALVVRGIKVEDIMGVNHGSLHSLTSFAKVKGTQITYPPEDAASGKLRSKKIRLEKTAARRTADRRRSANPAVTLNFPSRLHSSRMLRAAKTKTNGATISRATIRRRNSDDKVSKRKNLKKKDERTNDEL